MEFLRRGRFQRPQIERRNLNIQKGLIDSVRQSLNRLLGAQAAGDKPDFGQGAGRMRQNPDAPRLDQSGDGRGTGAEQPTLANPQSRAVIGHQAKSDLEGAQRKVALAHTRGPLDQDALPGAAVVKRDQAGVQDGADSVFGRRHGRQPRISGSSTTKRAPITLPDVSSRFSAQMRP